MTQTSPLETRKTRLVAAEAALFVICLVAAAWASKEADWRPVELVLLLAVMSVGSHLAGMFTRDVRISGSFLGLVLAMALLGPAPAVAIGVACVLIVGWYARTPADKLVSNLATYSFFPLLGAVLFEILAPEGGSVREGVAFVIVVIGLFLIINVINFLLIVGHNLVLGGGSLRDAFLRMYVPVLPWEIATSIITAIGAYGYELVGLSVIGMVAVMLLVFHNLLRSVLAAEQRREELAQRMEQLEKVHEGTLAVMLYTLSLRDRMTARHSAAVARYARATVRHVGMGEHHQQLAHTAGLLHDIGKFSFPDSILFAAVGLTPEQRTVVHRHPANGASVLRRVVGFEQIADIVEAHHERPDGEGYPAGLAGDAIPPIARTIAVAETYDVLVSPDSYRQPISHEAAVLELRRVSGTQLDPEVVDAFIAVVESERLAVEPLSALDLEAELKFVHRAALSSSG